ncbi:MAG: UDP-N-acetylglucosamine:LPS N-acetylglucosamine transferase [Parcubacteria group bacterium Gr01-1014_13]|nr:MAG: UDP-N-acetylglucosamine:LPS N-acetylglucosamine transferase [Parcubacteria group bacterium Gr01-1014_13]
MDLAAPVQIRLDTPNMSKKEKLLIVSCSTGSGHFRAGEALRLSCQKMYPEIQVQHIDLADYLSGFARTFSVSSYNVLIKHTPKAFKLLYFLTDKVFVQKILGVLRPFFKFGAKMFFKKIEDYQPDYILSTQFTPQLILPKNFPTPIDTLITDYHAHQVWLSPNVRNFFVASEETRNELKNLGLPSVVSGIPLHPRFFTPKDTANLKKELNINNDWPIILIMPIACGEIDVKEAINTIFSYNKNVNVVAISGKNNKKNFNELEKIKSSGQKNFIIIKATPRIDDWMRVADIIVSKAGGLTISEVIYLQKPLVVVNPIPGQEDYNTAYLEKNNYCLKADSNDDLAKKIKLLLLNPDIIQKKSHPNASEIILKKILTD